MHVLFLRILPRRDSLNGSGHGGSVLNGGDYISGSAAAAATPSSSSSAVAAAKMKAPLSAVRIAVLGGSGVGKSCLIQRLLKGKGNGKTTVRLEVLEHCE